ncbi:hypothetical protein N0V83_003763 [Neocucurbitaria cava]|uniref:DUF924-domain-containing protein n=1 Tax=Neocucurbitaria cava TaxID=798079 RepID=A0A9W8YA29_9PLEO|nr:hypothetical protein N0V83_003763 [Neocucurbitaria cava]
MSTSTAPSPTLDPSIFNPTLYRQLLSTWFPPSAIDLSGRHLDSAVLRRWFMGSPEERAQFDGECRSAFGAALEAIGPEKFKLPEGLSAAEPFLQELEKTIGDGDNAGGEGEEAAYTALALTLLLDQIPRNIFRSEEGLRKVYTHYDKISFEFATALLGPEVNANSPSPIQRRPDTHPLFARSAAHRLWFYLPLMHSESLAAHDRLDALLASYSQELDDLEASSSSPEGKEEDEEESLKGSRMFLAGQMKAEKEHRDILERFGRYPHRNEALGRQSTVEEEEFLQGVGRGLGLGAARGGEN